MMTGWQKLTTLINSSPESFFLFSFVVGVLKKLMLMLIEVDPTPFADWPMNAVHSALVYMWLNVVM
jgi:hypothetical protein